MYFFIKQIFCQINLRSISSNRKMTISDFQSQFSMSKMTRIFLNFFFHYRINTNLGAHFFYWHFLILSIFESLYFLKGCPLTQFSQLDWSKLKILSWIDSPLNLDNFFVDIWRLGEGTLCWDLSAFTYLLTERNSLFLLISTHLFSYFFHSLISFWMLHGHFIY